MFTVEALRERRLGFIEFRNDAFDDSYTPVRVVHTYNTGTTLYCDITRMTVFFFFLVKISLFFVDKTGVRNNAATARNQNGNF